MVAATGKKVNKSSFITDVLRSNPQANPTTVRAAWSAAGHAGSISSTLVSKLRAEMGLVGNIRKGRVKGSSNVGAAAAPKRKVGRPRRDASTPTNGSHVSETAPAPAPAPVKAARATDRDRILAELEGQFDHLIYKLIAVGGLENVEDAVRVARRLVVRGS